MHYISVAMAAEKFLTVEHWGGGGRRGKKLDILPVKITVENMRVCEKKG